MLLNIHKHIIINAKPYSIMSRSDVRSNPHFLCSDSSHSVPNTGYKWSRMSTGDAAGKGSCCYTSTAVSEEDKKKHINLLYDFIVCIAHVCFDHINERRFLQYLLLILTLRSLPSCGLNRPCH